MKSQPINPCLSPEKHKTKFSGRRWLESIENLRVRSSNHPLENSTFQTIISMEVKKAWRTSCTNHWMEREICGNCDQDYGRRIGEDTGCSILTSCTKVPELNRNFKFPYNQKIQPSGSNNSIYRSEQQLAVLYGPNATHTNPTVNVA